MVCRSCGTSRDELSTRVDQVRRLYNPYYSFGRPQPKATSDCAKSKLKCGRSLACSSDPNACMERRLCSDRYKMYWKQNCKVPCLSLYENQPWFKDPVVQKDWPDFIGQLVTPENIGCHLEPGPDDYQYKCNKVRAMMCPKVFCIWDLPEQDPCACVQYGYNRDWRRYNEDQRMEKSPISCGCSNEPICKPQKPPCEYPPYLGKKYGARYMGWAHPLSFMFPRTRPFNYQSMRC